MYNMRYSQNFIEKYNKVSSKIYKLLVQQKVQIVMLHFW